MATAPSESVGTRLMFENERVRVWDLRLAPGEQLPKHIHRHDYFFLIVSGSTIRFADPDNEADYRDIAFTDDQIAWVPVRGEGNIDNRLTNIGEKTHRNFVVEIKGSSPAIDTR